MNAFTVIKGGQITGAVRKEFAHRARAEYERGASIRAIAESMGRSYGWVHSLLLESGAAFRTRGGKSRGGEDSG